MVKGITKARAKTLIVECFEDDRDRIFAEFIKAHVVKDRRERVDRALIAEAYFAYCAREGTQPLRGQALRHRFTNAGIDSFGRGFRLRYVKFQQRKEKQT